MPLYCIYFPKSKYFFTVFEHEGKGGFYHEVYDFKKNSIPLCGFPYHALSSYISRLVEKGFKVAICEQVEDPKLAKGVVKREVTRVVTAGLVIDPDNLTAGENNFLAALYVS
ncbi:MAG TPA: hypothetical protein VJ202_06800, partial [Thermodesulfobacteriota bacterium]|nr:hypothetical protein [Thermodesulfobacteriota bacterium]